MVIGDWIGSGEVSFPFHIVIVFAPFRLRQWKNKQHFCLLLLPTNFFTYGCQAVPMWLRVQTRHVMLCGLNIVTEIMSEYEMIAETEGKLHKLFGLEQVATALLMDLMVWPRTTTGLLGPAGNEYRYQDHARLEFVASATKSLKCCNLLSRIVPIVDAGDFLANCGLWEFIDSWCDRSGSAAKRCEAKLHAYQGTSFAEVESGASFVRETWGGNGRCEAIWIVALCREGFLDTKRRLLI